MKQEDIEGGCWVSLRKDCGISYVPLYKKDARKMSVAGKVYPQEVCLVTDSFSKHRQIVTPHGEIGWVHVNLLEKVQANI